MTEDQKHEQLAAAIGAIRERHSQKDSEGDILLWKALAMMTSYHRHYSGNSYMRPIDVERSYMHTVDGTGDVPAIRAGKIDGVVSINGATYVLEHKTTSSDIGVGGLFWSSLTIDQQVSAYVLAERLSGRRVSGCVYDVLKKTRHRPKKVAKSEIDEESWLYFGAKMNQNDIDYYLSNSKESNRMFCFRLICIMDSDPESFFQRKVTHRSDDELADYAEDLRKQIVDIERAEKDGALYKNTSSCKDFNRPCQYLGICKKEALFDNGDWTQIADHHRELDLPFGTDHTKVHTHSSISCFQSCRTKWKYKYRDGWISKGNEEALYFGDLVHVGLEAWLKYEKQINERGTTPIGGPGATEEVGVAGDNSPAETKSAQQEPVKQA